MRPATLTSTRAFSSSSLVLSPKRSASSPARWARRKSLGNACPAPRTAFSFSRRSSTSLFSSSKLDSLLEARFDEVVELAVEHRLGRAFLHAGAQVLDARLVEHVRADLVSPADVGLRLLELLLLGLALAHLELVELRLKHRHRLGAVAVLRAVVLALHHDVGRQVCDAHRAIGAVHVLAARPGSAVGVYAQIRRVNLDLDRLVDLGVDEDAGKRGVAAGIGVERALAHQTVHSSLGAQRAVRVVATYLERRALDTRNFARGVLQHLCAEPPSVAELEVHALQHRRPVLRLGAARAGLDIDEAVVRVERVREHAPELHRGDVLFEFLNIGIHSGERSVVALGAGEAEELCGIGKAGPHTAESADYGFESLFLFAELLRPLRVIPKLRILEFAV